MPYRPTGNRPGRPPAAKVGNAHDAACHCCGIVEAIGWFWAVPDDGTPLEPLRPYRWFCSGEASGGTRRCSALARKVGAVPWVHNFNPRSPHDTLGIAADATMADIRTAYLRASRVHHPDKAGNSDEATRNFQEISAAFDVLKEREGQAQAAPEGGQEEPEEEEEEEDEDFDDEDEEEAEEEDEDRGDQAQEAQPEEEEQEHAAPDPARSRGTPRPKRAHSCPQAAQVAALSALPRLRGRANAWGEGQARVVDHNHADEACLPPHSAKRRGEAAVLPGEYSAARSAVC